VLSDLQVVEETEGIVVHEERQVVRDVPRFVWYSKESIDHDAFRVIVPRAGYEFRVTSLPEQSVANIVSPAHPFDVDRRLDRGGAKHQSLVA
jgi:hypothetical protein